MDENSEKVRKMRKRECNEVSMKGSEKERKRKGQDVSSEKEKKNF